LKHIIAFGAAAALGIAALFLPQNAAAQTSSPQTGSGLMAKPVRIVVPGPPGGPAGAISLLIANKLGKYINQTVIVENKPGAGGNIGIEYVARSAPDGFTLFFGVPALITNPYFQKAHLDPSLLTPVIQLNTGAFLLLVNANSEMKSVNDVVAKIKASPGNVSCNSGAVALSTVSCHLLQSYAGPMLMVAYPGNAQALAALDRNEIDLAFDFTSSSGARVKEGKLRALAITSKNRNTGDFKDVPPISETVPGFELVGWQGIMAPKDTPRDIVMNLNAALNKVLQEDELVAFTRNGNLELAGGTPERFGEQIKRDYEMYGRITKEAKIEPQ
jgi:tripartite-type tricarboxylate transporter receptor subunit TctC